MDKNQFAAFLACAVVPPIVQLIQQKKGQATLDLMNSFYPKVYELLENEESKLWHYSALTLCNMYLSEQKNGKIDFPEEAA